MSAFIVNPDHIDYLVTAAITANIPCGPRPEAGIRWHGARVEDGTADAVGAGLLAANIASVQHRYRHRADVHAPDPDAYRYRRFHGHEGNIAPAALLKAIDCYEYQSCEHPGWPESEAARFCDHLRTATIRTMPGYADAPWEVTRS